MKKHYFGSKGQRMGRKQINNGDGKMKVTHPHIIEEFKKHCEAGWSPHSFCAKLKSGAKTYYFLMQNDPVFKVISDFYNKPKGKNQGFS